MKENKSYFKSQKGITLVALIITIVLMFVLARVTVSSLIGPDGIIARARESASEVEKLKIYEQISAIAADMQTDGILDTGAILKKLKKEFEVTESGVNYENGKIILDEKIVKIKGKNGEYKYFIDENEVRMTDKELAEIKEGDIVLFDSDLNGKKEEWILLNDNINESGNKTNYIEIASTKVMKDLSLGKNDSWIKWNDPEIINDANKVDENDGTILSEIEKTIYSYNNAISTMNEYSKSFIPAENIGVRNISYYADTEQTIEEAQIEYMDESLKKYLKYIRKSVDDGSVSEEFKKYLKLLNSKLDQLESDLDFSQEIWISERYGHPQLNMSRVTIGIYTYKISMKNNIWEIASIIGNTIGFFYSNGGSSTSTKNAGVLPVVKLEYDG